MGDLEDARVLLDGRAVVVRRLLNRLLSPPESGINTGVIVP